MNNALAEAVNGLYKAELIHAAPPGLMWVDRGIEHERSDQPRVARAEPRL